MAANIPDLTIQIEKEKALTDDIVAKLKESVNKFKEKFSATV